MAGLPTYEEAVSGGHWLGLVAPYVALRDYARLCSVSRRFYHQFAPRLWKDPLQTLRRLGRADPDNLDWYGDFVTQQAACARAATRQLVASLDFRGLALEAVPWFPSAGVDSLSLSLRRLVGLFPATRCLVLDGVADYDPAHLAVFLSTDAATPDGSAPAPLLLSLTGCRLPLPSVFFDAPRWRLLVYLDLSYLPESLRPLFRPGPPAFHGALPNLRILKLRGRRVDDALLAQLAVFAANQPLWSLDLGHNKVSDAGVCRLLRPCFGGGRTAASPSLFDVEGRLAPAVAGAAVPELAYIAESPWSASSSHPARYLADAPGYSADHAPRLAGNEPLRSDDVDAIRDAVAGPAGQPAPDWHGLLHDTDSLLGVARRPSPGLTHLHLSGNPDFTVHGIDLLFRTAQGRLEHFDCAAPSIPPPSSSPTFAFSLAGLLGRSHLFRPVVAANLRSLRIHHSLVTHIPSVIRSRPGTGRRATLADDCYAETVLRARADGAFPAQAFEPDHNPRLQSLVLTGLPRHSAGPLRDRLLRLLLLAYEQQEAIRMARRAPAASAARRRGPAMLRGLRHIRLEFAPPAAAAAAAVAADDAGGYDTGGDSFADLDAAALLQDATEDAFSFFAGETWSAPAPASASAPAVAQVGEPTAPTRPLRQQQTTARPTSRLPHYPLPAGASAGADDAVVGSASVRDAVAVWDPVRAQTVSVPVAVWVGSGIRSPTASAAAGPGPGAAVDAYMQNLAQPALRTRIQPASPGQVRAGVPAGACVYNAAWDAILWTGLDDDDDDRARQPRMPHPLPPMHDVVEALRVFRAETRAAYAAYSESGAADTDDADDGPDARPWTMPPHRHWTGTLELVLPR